MSDIQSNNKQIAKNTLAMYVRMLFLMLISFYTSRVVLQALGEEDFGIYNIVGGLVVLFTFVNGAMTTGTQRHLSYELGKTDGNLSRIFSACFNIHIWLAIGIVVLAETIGLWFLNTQMNFPEGRIGAVNWVYQLSIVTCVISVIRIPYNAAIIAYEKMSFYAYIGIIEGVLKLLIVYLLSLAAWDKLVFYSFLIAAVTLVGTLAFVFYCKHKFKYLSYIKIHDGQLYKDLLSFSGWTIFGSVANIARNQGIGIIINIFYGVTLNAAIGIAHQVNAAISQFVSGFQQAFYPQLTKVEAQKDREIQTALINRTAKFSYLIILFFAVPILYNLDYLLTLWLGEYPLYTKEICFWIVVATLIDSLSGPLWVTIFATGKIKSYQIIISFVFLLNLPLTYLCGNLGWQPQYAFVFQAFINMLAILIRIEYIKRLIDYPVFSFFRKVILPIAIVTLLLCPFFIGLNIFHIDNINFLSFLWQSIVVVLIESVVIWFIGLSGSERKMLLCYFHHISRKIK